MTGSVYMSGGTLQVGGTTEPGKISLFQSDTKTYSTSTSNDADLFIVRVNPSAISNQIASLQLVSSGNNGSNAGRGIISVIQTNQAISSGDIAFQNNNAGTIAERMRITSAGNVGIGTSSPNSQLHVGAGSQTPNNLANTRLIIANSGNSGRAALLTISNDGSGNQIEGQFESSGESAEARLILGSATNHPLTFRTNNSERMRITSTGVLELTSGQLKFPSSQNASADANTLDDYEEGTWTPTIASGGFSISSISLANYTKIGRVVQCIADFTLSGTGTSSALYIGGLPFTNLLNGWSASAAYFQFVNIDNKQLVAVVMSGATTIQFTLSPASNVGGNTRAANGNDFSAGYMNVNVTYFV
jgi:hypothetical protein